MLTILVISNQAWLILHRLCQVFLTSISPFLTRFKIAVNISPDISGPPTIRLNLSYTHSPLITFSIPITVGTLFTILAWIYRSVSST